MSAAIIVFLLLLSAALAVGYARLLRRFRNNVRKVKFTFDAIDNVDYSFSFPVEGKGADDQMANMALNRIKTVMQKARSEALEREKYYEQIINLADTGILVVNSRGNVLQHNRAALRLLGVEILTHIDRVKDRLNDGRLSKHETAAELKGRKVSIITLSDINNELANQEIDSWVKLTRVLTHEIMNTVTPITSLSETLLRNAKGEQRDGLEVISKTSKELVSFVESYRRFTHVPKPNPALFYVRPFLQRMVRLAGRPVSLSCEPPDLMLYADESLVAHVVTNVLRNAVQATEDGGQISVAAFSDSREAVVIDITNSGSVMPDDVAQHIFVPFFTTKPDGSGIGLSLSRQIMRLSNGSITLRQDKERGLVTFELTFF